jgi:hypothetical protein
MINKYEIRGDTVEMVVSDKLVLFDLEDFPKLDRFNQWKLSRSKSIVTDYRKGKEMMRITLHSLLTGYRFVKWINGNVYDFRKTNMERANAPSHHKVGEAPPKGNDYKFEDNFIIVVLKDSKGQVYKVYADHDDYATISQYTWNRNSGNGYIQTRLRLGRAENKTVYMHRLIMGVSGHKTYVDHINGDKLDNRKVNLRICTPSQNGHNKHNQNSTVTGVSRVVVSYWEARIQINKVPRLKRFKTYEEALAQRRAWEKEFNPSGLKR